jgi:hypothetical protein
MAQLNTQTLTIKVSKLIRDQDTPVELLDAEVISQLEAVITELAGAGILVEIDVE